MRRVLHSFAVRRYCQEQDLAARILAALGSSDAENCETNEAEGGKNEQLEIPHLLGILQMEENLTAQKAAAEQLAQEVREVAFTRTVNT